MVVGLYTLRATFSDPGDEAPWNYTIDWGDGLSHGGSTSSRNDAITATHPYLLPGTYRIRVTVVDTHEAAGSDDLLLTVKLPRRRPSRAWPP